jgi:hypothetical protein
MMIHSVIDDVSDDRAMIRINLQDALEKREFLEWIDAYSNLLSFRC